MKGGEYMAEEPIITGGGTTPASQPPAAQPAALQPQQQPVTTAPVQQPGAGAGAPVVPQPPFTGNLPVGTSEYTGQQFERLKDSNKRLNEANRLLNDELMRRQQVAEQFAPIQTTPQPQQPKVEDYIETDPITGEQIVNTLKLNKALEETQQRASRAETTVQNYIKNQQWREEQKQTEDAYKSYPQLNPENPQNFDTELSKRTRRVLFDSMMNPVDYGGRALTFKEAADLANGEIVKPQAQQPAVQQPTVQQSAAQQPPQTQPAAAGSSQEGAMEQKNQASSGAQGVSSSAVQPTNPDVELENLRMRSRQGDLWAIAQRLTKIPHTGTPKSSSET